MWMALSAKGSKQASVSRNKVIRGHRETHWTTPFDTMDSVPSVRAPMISIELLEEWIDRIVLWGFQIQHGPPLRDQRDSMPAGQASQVLERSVSYPPGSFDHALTG